MLCYFCRCPWTDEHSCKDIRFDGRWPDYPPDLDPRQWTLFAHFIDAQGYDRYKGSFNIDSLMALGVIVSENREVA